MLFADNSATQNFEVRLYENDPLKKFEVVIGTLNSVNADHNYVSGVQGDSGAGVLHAGLLHSYSSAECLQHLYLAWLWNPVANTNTYRNTDANTMHG